MILKIKLIAFQVIITIAISSFFSYIATTYNFKSVINGIWGFMIPAVIAIYFNREKTMQIFMALFLMAISFMIAGFTAVFSGF